jgi:hypothetical protein
MMAKWLDQSVGRQDVIVVLLGLLSAIVDNVPLVAASMGMYSLAQYPPDSFLWEFIAYCAGTEDGPRPEGRRRAAAYRHRSSDAIALIPERHDLSLHRLLHPAPS